MCEDSWFASTWARLKSSSFHSINLVDPLLVLSTSASFQIHMSSTCLKSCRVFSIITVKFVILVVTNSCKEIQELYMSIQNLCLLLHLCFLLFPFVFFKIWIIFIKWFILLSCRLLSSICRGLSKPICWGLSNSICWGLFKSICWRLAVLYDAFLIHDSTLHVTLYIKVWFERREFSSWAIWVALHNMSAHPIRIWASLLRYSISYYFNLVMS